jgi:hypothetical protein
MITGEALADAVEIGTFIIGGIADCAEGIKYDFRISSRILKASFGVPIDMDTVATSERSGLFVEPGEMVFTLTEERLKLPRNMFAELSPKRKLSHSGILAMVGFVLMLDIKGVCLSDSSIFLQLDSR